MYLYVVVFVVLLALAFYHLQKDSKTCESFQTQNIIIFGLSNSSKTQLFYKLTEDTLVQTTTSFTVNKKNVKFNDQDIQILDVPGYASFKNDVVNNLKNGSVLLMLVNTENKFIKKKFCLRFCLDFI